MDSQLLQTIPSPRRKVVEGRHVTYGGAHFHVTKVGFSDHPFITVKQGIIEGNGKSNLSAGDLRELSALFIELADAMEGR